MTPDSHPSKAQLRLSPRKRPALVRFGLGESVVEEGLEQMLLDGLNASAPLVGTVSRPKQDSEPPRSSR